MGGLGKPSTLNVTTKGLLFRSLKLRMVLALEDTQVHHGQPRIVIINIKKTRPIVLCFSTYLAKEYSQIKVWVQPVQFFVTMILDRPLECLNFQQDSHLTVKTMSKFLQNIIGIKFLFTVTVFTSHVCFLM
jgi:hypothetical protein